MDLDYAEFFDKILNACLKENVSTAGLAKEQWKQRIKEFNKEWDFKKENDLIAEICSWNDEGLIKKQSVSLPNIDYFQEKIQDPTKWPYCLLVQILVFRKNTNERKFVGRKDNPNEKWYVGTVHNCHLMTALHVFYHDNVLIDNHNFFFWLSNHLL